MRLWRDANPDMVRYLRVISTGDPYDIACESWITVIRGLSGFRGDEVAWRSWIFASARMRAEDEGMQRVWHAFESALEDPALEDLEEPLSEAEMSTRELDLTLEAIRALPTGQGEVVMLRLAGGLPPATIAHVVGSDTSTVKVCERRALERLGADPELIAWSLSAEPLPAELADEVAALVTLRAITPTAARQAPRPRTLRLPISRLAGVGAAVASAGVFGLGGVSAAAYVGVLPAPVQDVMHRVIGAPPATPSPTGEGPDGRGGSDGRGGWDGQGGSQGPSTPDDQAAPSASAGGSETATTTGTAVASGLCRDWADDEKKGLPKQRSTAYAKVVAAAGGADKVTSYCTSLPRPGTSATKEGTTTSGKPGTGTPSTSTTTPPTTSDTTTTPPTTSDTTTPPTTTPPTTGDTTTPPTTSEGTTPPTSETPSSDKSKNGPASPSSKTKTKTHESDTSTTSSTSPAVDVPGVTTSLPRSGRASDRATTAVAGGPAIADGTPSRAASAKVGAEPATSTAPAE